MLSTNSFIRNVFIIVTSTKAQLCVYHLEFRRIQFEFLRWKVSFFYIFFLITRTAAGSNWTRYERECWYEKQVTDSGPDTPAPCIVRFFRFLFRSVEPRSPLMNMNIYKGYERAVKQFILLQILNKWTSERRAPCEAIRTFIESFKHSQKVVPWAKLLQFTDDS